MDSEEKQENERLKHLEFIEGTISRMNQCSFNLKGWAVGLTSALIGFFASNLSSLAFPIWIYTAIIIIPIVIFWTLDSFYLQQERKFRDLYNDVAHLHPARSIRAFDMSLSRYKGNRCSYIENFFSKTEFGFYGFIILLIIGIAAAIMNTKR